MSSRRRHVQKGGRDQGSQRSSRLNELLREIIAEELKRIEDDRLDWVSITHVRTDRSLDRAVVLFTAALGEVEDEIALVDVFEEHRKRLQAAIGRQTTLRRTPPLIFEPDLHLRSASRIEDLLAQDRTKQGSRQPRADDDGSGAEVSSEDGVSEPRADNDGSGAEVSSEEE